MFSQFLNEDVLRQCQDYFSKLPIDKSKQVALESELAMLYSEILTFSDELNSREDYLNLIIELVTQFADHQEESTLLESLIPLWQALRGTKISRNKPIDEFYYQFEMVLLWRLLVVAVTSDNFTHASSQKMRAIIRRYSNMPVMWQYLCQLSDEQIQTAYTF